MRIRWSLQIDRPLLTAPAGGYLLEVVAADDRAVLGAISAFVEAQLGAEAVAGAQLGRAQFLLRPSGTSLATAFRAMEANKARLKVRVTRSVLARWSLSVCSRCQLLGVLGELPELCLAIGEPACMIMARNRVPELL